MVKRKRRTTNKIPSEKQRRARKRAWCLFRLRGMVASLTCISNDIEDIDFSSKFDNPLFDITKIINYAKDGVNRVTKSIERAT